MLHFLLAPFLAVASLFAPHADFTSVVDTVSSSTVRITGMKHGSFFGMEFDYVYTCTGFVIEHNPGTVPDRVLTAEHCLGEKMLADGKPVRILKGDEYFDLGLIETDSTKLPLVLRDEPVVRFESVNGIGYGYGFDKLIVTFNKVILTDYSPDPEMAPGIWFDGAFIGGMSGGPVFDKDGKVVSVVQRRTDEGTGYGVNILTVKAFLLGTK